MAQMRTDLASGRAEVGRAAEQMSAQLERVGQAADRLTGSMARVGHYGAAMFGVDQIMQYAGKVVALADEMTMLDGKLLRAAGGAEAAARAHADLLTMAQNLRIPLAENADLFARLTPQMRNLGRGTDEAMQVTEAFALSLRVSNASVAASKSGMEQFAQAMNTGRLNGDEFVSVATAAPRFIDALAASLGRSSGEMKKMAEEGQLTAEVILAAAQQSLPQLRAEFEQVPLTVDQAMTQAANKFGSLVGGINQASGASNLLARGIGVLTDHMEGLLQTAGLLAAAMISRVAASGLLVAKSKWDAVRAAQAERQEAVAMAQQSLLDAQFRQREALQRRELIQLTIAQVQAELRLEQTRLAAQISEQGRLARSRELHGLGLQLNGLHQQLARQSTALAGAETATALATRNLATAQTAASLGSRALSGTLGVLRGGLAMLGGPLGLLFTGLSAGVLAWQMWGQRSEEAVDVSKQTTGEIISDLNAQIAKQKELAQLQQMGGGDELMGQRIQRLRQEYDTLQASVADSTARAADAARQGSHAAAAEFARMGGAAMKSAADIKQAMEDAEAAAKGLSTSMPGVSAGYVTEMEKVLSEYGKLHAQLKAGKKFDRYDEQRAAIEANDKWRASERKAAIEVINSNQAMAKKVDAFGSAGKAAHQAERAYDGLIRKLRNELVDGYASAEAAQHGYNKAQTDFLKLAGSAEWGKLSANQKAVVAGLYEQIVAQEQSAAAIKQAESAWADLHAELERSGKVQSEGLDALLADIASLEHEIERYGMTRQQVAAYDLALLDQQIEQERALLAEVGARSSFELDALERKRAAMARYAELAGVREARESNDKLVSEMEQSWNGLSSSIGNGLSSAFDQAGRSLAGLVGAMANYRKSQAEILSRQKSAIAVANQSNDVEKRGVAIQRANQLAATESLQAQSAMYGDLAGSAKGFFKEGSDGYRLLGAAEKGFRIFEMAMAVQSFAQKSGLLAAFTGLFATSKAQEIALTQTSAASNIAAAAAEGQAKATLAVATQGGGDPYTAFPRIAAMAAIMAALGFAVSGGGGKSIDYAKQRQAAAGAGTVLGDASAKSESIANSIEIMERNSGLGVGIQNSMLMVLRSIDANMKGLSGIVIKSGVVSNNPAAALVNTGFETNAFGKIQQSILKPFTKIPVIGDLFKGLSNLVGKLFGTKTSVLDQGIYAQAQSLAAIRSGGLQASSYATVEEKKKFLGITTSTKVSEQLAGLPKEVTDQFGLVIRSLAEGTEAAAAAIGIGGDQFNAALSGFVVNIGHVSLKDLNGQQIQEQFSTIFSRVGDDMAKAAAPWLAEFQRVGEGMFETLARVGGEVQVTDAIMQRMGRTGTSAFGAIGAASIRAREQLIDLSGGIEKLADKTGYFYEHFTTEESQRAAKIAQTQAALAALGGGFASLNLNAGDARQQFAALVNAIDLTSDAGRRQFVGALDIAEAVDGLVAEFGKGAAGVAKAKEPVAEFLAGLRDQLADLTADRDEIAQVNAELVAGRQALANYAGTVAELAEAEQLLVRISNERIAQIEAERTAQAAAQRTELGGAYRNELQQLVAAQAGLQAGLAGAVRLLPKTGDEFMELAQGADAASTAGRGLLDKLGAVKGAFDTIQQAIGNAGELKDAVLARFKSPAQLLDDAKAKLAAALLSVGVAMPATADGLAALVREADVYNGSNLQMLTVLQANRSALDLLLDAERAAAEARQQQATQAANSVSQLFNQFASADQKLAAARSRISQQLPAEVQTRVSGMSGAEFAEWVAGLNQADAQTQALIISLGGLSNELSQVIAASDQLRAAQRAAQDSSAELFKRFADPALVAAQAQSRLTIALAQLGEVVPRSNEAVLSLLQGLDMSSTRGQALVAVLREHADALTAVIDGEGALQRQRAETQASIVQLQGQYGSDAQKLAQARRSVQQSLGEGWLEKLSGMDGAAFNDLLGMLNAADPATQRLIASLGQLGGELGTLFGEVERQRNEREQQQQRMQQLQLELLQASGNELAALAMSRQLELQALSASEQALKREVWALQDASKLREQAAEQLRAQRGKEVELLEALGLKSEALALRRELELAAMDANLRGMQQLIWSVQDMAEISNQAAEAQQRYIDGMREAVEFIGGVGRNIRGYLDGLHASDAGLGTPRQQMDAAQQAYASQLQLARGGDRDALGNITQYADRWRESASKFYGGGMGAQGVLAEIERTLGALPGQLSPEQFLAGEIRNALREQTDALARAIAANNPAALAQAVLTGFGQLDRDRSGGISFAELQAALAGKATDAQLQLILAALDLNGDGVVSQLEALLGQLDGGNALLLNALAGVGADGLTLEGARQLLAPLAGDGQITQLLQLIDRNGDGMLSQQELANARLDGLVDGIGRTLLPMFTKLDQDLSGGLTLEEFRTAFAGFELGPRLDQLYRSYDRNGDGIISKQEAALLLSATQHQALLQALTDRSPLNIAKALAGSFDALRGGVAGVLTFEQLRVGLAGKASDAQIQALIAAVDFSRDGTLSQLEAQLAQHANGNLLLLNALSGVGSAVLTFEQARSVLAPLASDGQITQLLQTIDANGDGLISQQELANLRLNGLGDAIKQSLTPLFGQLDTTLDGVLSLDEFRQAFGGFGLGDRLDAIFRELDVNGDGTISRLEAANAAMGSTAGNTASTANQAVLTNAALQALRDNGVQQAQIAAAMNASSAQMALLLESIRGSSGSQAASSVQMAMLLDVITGVVAYEVRMMALRSTGAEGGFIVRNDWLPDIAGNAWAIRQHAAVSAHETYQLAMRSIGQDGGIRVQSDWLPRIQAEAASGATETWWLSQRSAGRDGGILVRQASSGSSSSSSSSGVLSVSPASYGANGGGDGAAVVEELRQVRAELARSREEAARLMERLMDQSSQQHGEAQGARKDQVSAVNGVKRVLEERPR